MNALHTARAGPLGALTLLTALAACSSESDGTPTTNPSASPEGDAPPTDALDFPEPVRADYGAAVFGADSAVIINPWLALGAGRKSVFEGETDKGTVRHAGQVVSCTTILEHVWNYSFDPCTNVVEARWPIAPRSSSTTCAT